MFPVNDKLQQHNRSVFSTRSQRHVAEQIETLYWNTVTHETAQADRDAVAVKKGTDLTTSEAVQTLPEDCEDLHLHPDREVEEVDQARYRELQARLEELAATRDRQQVKLGQYRQLQTMLRPFENALENIQPNLVTGDGEMRKELDRMRLLLARITERMAEVRTTAVRRVEPPAPSNEQKLLNVMDLT